MAEDGIEERVTRLGTLVKKSLRRAFEELEVAEYVVCHHPEVFDGLDLFHMVAKSDQLVSVPDAVEIIKARLELIERACSISRRRR
jgi:hypothetical protein